MSNDPGYKIIKAPPAPRDLIDAAKAEISTDNLSKFLKSTSSLGFERLGWGEINDRLLHREVEFGDDEFLKTLLKQSYQDAKIIESGVVVWMNNPTKKMRFKAGVGRVFIYRALEKALGPDTGFFRIVEGSHRKSFEASKAVQAKDIYLDPGDLIIMDGDLVIEYPQPGGGVGLMQSLWKLRQATG